MNVGQFDCALFCALFSNRPNLRLHIFTIQFTKIGGLLTAIYLKASLFDVFDIYRPIYRFITEA